MGRISAPSWDEDLMDVDFDEELIKRQQKAIRDQMAAAEKKRLEWKVKQDEERARRESVERSRKEAQAEKKRRREARERAQREKEDRERAQRERAQRERAQRESNARERAQRDRSDREKKSQRSNRGKDYDTELHDVSCESLVQIIKRKFPSLPQVNGKLKWGKFSLLAHPDKLNRNTSMSEDKRAFLTAAYKRAAATAPLFIV